MLGELEKNGITSITGAEVKEISGNSVIFTASGEKKSLSADTVVLAAGYRPSTGLLENLKSAGVKESYVIGDCLEPRKAMDAIKEGFRVGSGV